jgi:dolichyl-phosphate beta-glucosyltransferase
VKTKRVYLSVVIPAYNEESKIEKDLSVLYAYLSKQKFEYEVIVVDDGSRDRTFETVRSLEKKYKNLNAVGYERNRGKGCAVRTGVLRTKGEYVLFADAGSCVPYENLETGLRLLRGRYGVALGSRGLAESRILVQQPKYRQLGSKAFGFIVRLAMGVHPIRDTQCGFKLFKGEAARSIFHRNRTEGFMFDTETILNAKKMGYKIVEFPVAWKNDPDTRFDPVRGSVRNMKELFWIKWRTMA